MTPKGFQIVDFPVTRLATADVGRFGLKKHYMFGLLELDVTEARSGLRKLRQSGKEVSLTAWLLRTIAECAAANPLLHAIKRGRRSLVTFSDVDISIVVERQVQGRQVPLPLVIRGANHKTAGDIDAEIYAALQEPVSQESDYILGRHGLSHAALRLYYGLPQVLRLLAWKLLFSNPLRAQRLSGTVMVTTVNAVGGSPGWIIPTRNMHNLALSFGSISKKPWVLNGQVVVRDIMSLTVTFNHDVIDGVPARKFVQELVTAIQNFRHSTMSNIQEKEGAGST